MTTPKKGDLVIVREKRGAFKKDVLYVAECVIGHWYNIVGLERLSDRLPILVCVDDGDDSKFTIEEVIPKEKLPRPIPVDLVDDIVKREAASPYPLEVGDEVEIHWEGERATGIGVVSKTVHNTDGHFAYVSRTLSCGNVQVSMVDARSGVHVHYPSCRVTITRKNKPKQNMCNRNFEYKPGQEFCSTSGIKFEVVFVVGDIAYARRISEPMWFTRIEYNDGKHVCVDDPCVTFKPIDPPLVAEVKELIAELQHNHHKIESATPWELRNLVISLNEVLK